VDVEKLFTHRWKLDQAEEAYKLFDTQTTGKASSCVLSKADAHRTHPPVPPQDRRSPSRASLTLNASAQ